MLPEGFDVSITWVFTIRRLLSEALVSHKCYTAQHMLDIGLLRFIKDTVQDIPWSKKKNRYGGELPLALDNPLKEVLAAYGADLDANGVKELIWRISAGLEWMRWGRSMAPSFAQIDTWFDTWVPLWIESIRYSMVSQTGKQMMAVTFRVLHGPFGGLAFTQHMPHSYLTKKLAKDIGFPIYGHVHFGELVQCVLVGRLALSEAPRVRIDEVAEYGRALSHNQKLRRERAKPCPYGHQWLCHECSMGHEGPVSCGRGTHQTTWVTRLCPGCTRESWFDPQSKSSLCLPCRTAEARAHARVE